MAEQQSRFQQVTDSYSDFVQPVCQIAFDGHMLHQANER